MLASATTATAFCGILCGVLALFMNTFRQESQTAPPLQVSNEVSPKVSKPESTLIPLNLLSVANSPVKFTPTRSIPGLLPSTTDLAFPANDFVVRDMELEELNFDYPFTKAKPIAQKAPANKPTKSDNRIANKDKTASLARKIAREPSLISRSTPTYPRTARKKGLEGKVIITITIGSTGKVAASYVSQSCGHPSLDSSALSAVRNYRFKPAINGLGQAVPVKRKIPFNFQLAG